MNKGFFLRLAKTNIKKNAKTYIPFMLTSMFTIMMFYNMCALSLNMGLDKMRGASSLKTILFLGTIVIAIFSIIFLFYTNSFLVKRRKKEFGLFNILGMEKRHIAKVLVLESVITSSISIVLGLAIGILLSKLLFLALLKLLSYEVTFGFEISPIAIIATIILFVITFTLTLLNTLRQLHFSKPIELLRGGNVGEKEPKTKWLLAIFGAICLGLAYFIALTTESPLLAMPMFFLAVLLVIAGTYFLFTAGSIAILKILRSNKKYYYHT
ncbi:MAG: FtsX-like permease family protein, partial [Oscillospiraceae bacterium]